VTYRRKRSFGSPSSVAIQSVRVRHNPAERGALFATCTEHDIMCERSEELSKELTTALALQWV
jgi:hypothetical protein